MSNLKFPIPNLKCEMPDFKFKLQLSNLSFQITDTSDWPPVSNYK
jgi:hypothetical protein